MIPVLTGGTTPQANTETTLLSALFQSPADRVTPLAEQLLPQDFTPAGAVIFNAIIEHAQNASQTSPITMLNLPVVHASLSAQGAFNGHDNGTRALLNEVATTPADPLWMPQLAQALILDAYHRAYDAYQITVAENHPADIGIEESDTAQRQALERLRAARSRIHTTTPTSKAGSRLAAA